MSEQSSFIARQRADGQEQALLAHLQGVAELAARFAGKWGAQQNASLAGYWHDLGKYRPGFQQYIREVADAHCEVSTMPADKTHSGAGALWAQQQFAQHPITWRVLAWMIASHHSGLRDWSDLIARLQDPKTARELQEALAAAPRELLQQTRPDSKPLGGKAGFHLWLRMQFSALVDADFLDTEAFMEAEKNASRYQFPSLAEMQTRFNAYMQNMVRRAEPTPVNQIRAAILADCLAQAGQPQGVFTLTVPTGGGKTLASLGFALEHAKVHGLQRIIYAIPYTSIIEQNANVMRQVFGEDSFIEHHSNAESESEDRHTRLAAENWDAPLVLSTNVQLFESLFANKTSRCRKLHNLCHSVIVLDEAQMLPVEFLQPIIDSLKLLVAHYGVSLVLCTATQPALNQQEESDGQAAFAGFASREIVSDPEALHRQLQRVDVHLPADLQQAQDWDEIAAEVAQHACVLAIVNTKQSAYELWKRLPQGSIHLSALMCGQHRSDLIEQIRQTLQARRQALAAGLTVPPLRVVSTQLIEAGVDVDFPVVFRALAGLDSIAQAAGRCNREGRMLGRGQVYVFVPPIAAPPGLLRKGVDSCKSVLHGVQHGVPEEVLKLQRFSEYFQQWRGKCNLDQHQIKQDLQASDADFPTPAFASVAKKFKLIDDKESASIFVHYSRDPQGQQALQILLATLKAQGPQRWLMRKLQRYSVSVYQHDLQGLLRQGDVEEIFPGIYLQVSDLLYDAELGVKLDGQPGDPASCVI